MSEDYGMNEFLEELKSGLEDAFEGQNVVLRDNMVQKNNCVRHGISASFDNSNVAPTVYPERSFEAYQSGIPMETIVSEYKQQLEEAHRNSIQMPELTREAAKEHISFSVMNAEKNKELLENIPHERMADLAAVPRWHINDEASFLVSNGVANQLKMTGEEILDIARSNTESIEFNVKSMNEVIRDMCKEKGMPDDMAEAMTQGNSMYVITNASKLDGASAIMSDNALTDAREMMGEDYYILPSSRHEILAVPESMVDDPAALKSMVEEVNATQVAEEDYLSDNVYHYDGINHEVTPCFDEMGQMIETNNEAIDLTEVDVNMNASGMGGM